VRAYRRSILREWLVLEVRISLDWPKDYVWQERKASWGLGVGFEMYFGGGFTRCPGGRPVAHRPAAAEPQATSLPPGRRDNGSKVMTDVTLERVGHQAPKVSTADMYQREMIAGLEVDVRDVLEASIDHHIDPIRLAQRGNGTRLAVLKETWQRVLACQPELPAELLVDSLKIQPVARGNNRHQVAAVIFQDNALREPVPRNAGGLRGAGGILSG